MSCVQVLCWWWLSVVRWVRFLVRVVLLFSGKRMLIFFIILWVLLQVVVISGILVIMVFSRIMLNGLWLEFRVKVLNVLKQCCVFLIWLRNSMCLLIFSLQVRFLSCFFRWLLLRIVSRLFCGRCGSVVVKLCSRVVWFLFGCRWLMLLIIQVLLGRCSCWCVFRCLICLVCSVVMLMWLQSVLICFVGYFGR